MNGYKKNVCRQPSYKTESKIIIDNSEFLKDYTKTFEQSFPWVAYYYETYEELNHDLRNNKLDTNLIQEIQNYLIDKIESIA